MGTAIKHPMPDRVKSSFVIFDIQELWCSALWAECPDVKNYKWRLNPVWHRMLYSCTHMTTVGIKGLMKITILFLVIQYKLNKTTILHTTHKHRA